jgi:hypothetical protein
VTTAQLANPLESFQWTPQPQAHRIILELARNFLGRSPFARKVAADLHAQAAVRFVDLIDQIQISHDDGITGKLLAAGFSRQSHRGQHDRYVQEAGIFPTVVVKDSGPMAVYLKAESVADFLVAWQKSASIEGAPLSAMRRARVAQTDQSELWVIERHGYPDDALPPMTPHETVAVLNHAEASRRRRRLFADEVRGFAHAHKLIDASIADLGVNRACDLFFAAEREYWQQRNRAARVQKARQDRLGIGWANHDHHTYRSSREHFARMIEVFERLGFHCRERFYAGAQAGWGAQVLEQPQARIVIFADVDLSPDELMGDFAHAGLEPRDDLGTVGLWCALHGEAFLEAGMHHLECTFDFSALKRQFERDENVKVMKPFTNFSYLRQAFTEGEIWPVQPERIDRLLRAGRITNDQASQFREHGALGSHLENLERNDGFKGFNQTGVSEIIARTDPRKQAGLAPSLVPSPSGRGLG